MEKEKAIGILQAVKAGTADAFIRKAAIKDALDMAISALEKQEADRWIPVTERLPEVHESGNSFSGIFMQSNPVLVYGTEEFAENAHFHVVTYCDDLDGHTYWSTELDAFTVNGVKAWRPLPEPYQEEES